MEGQEKELVGLRTESETEGVLREKVLSRWREEPGSAGLGPPRSWADLLAAGCRCAGCR